MCDLFLEMIKTLTISRSQLNKRFILKNPSSLNQLESYNKSIVIMYGHYASYEWSSVLQSHINLAGLAIYKKIANKYFDKLVRQIRSKYKTELVDSKKALVRIKQLNSSSEKRMIAFLSDQSPKNRPHNVWLNFMNIKVPCFVGAEMTAKKYDYPVGYLQINKVKRGHYEAEFVVLSEKPNETEAFEITKKFNALLEKQIHNQPEYYLWTHKRWKHKDKAPLK